MEGNIEVTNNGNVYINYLGNNATFNIKNIMTNSPSGQQSSNIYVVKGSDVKTVSREDRPDEYYEQLGRIHEMLCGQEERKKSDASTSKTNAKGDEDRFINIGKDPNCVNNIFEKLRELKEKGSIQTVNADRIANDADALYRSQNYKEAFAQYVKAALLESAYAQYKVGIYYMKGNDTVPVDPKKAVTWYQQAADQDYAEAQYSLGECYEQGHGVAKNISEAVKWYKKAATQGHADAQYKMGELEEKHFNNLSEANDWYKRLINNPKYGKEAKEAVKRISEQLRAQEEKKRKALEAQRERDSQLKDKALHGCTFGVAILSLIFSLAVFILACRPDCLPSYSDYKGAAFVTFYICDICCFIASIVLYWVSFVKLGLEDDNTPCLFVIIIYILGLVSGVLCGIVVKDEVGRVGLGLWISGLVLFIIGFIVIAAYYYKKRGFNMPVLMRVIICAYIVPAVFALSLVGGALSFEKIPDKHYVLESDGTYSYVMDESSYGAEVLFIHARYDGKPVTKVAKSQTLSDEANYNLKKIIIPVSVNDIEMGILSGCENLEDLIVPYVGYSDVGAVNGYDGEAEYIRPIGWLFGTASFDGGVETKQNDYVKYLSGTKKGNSNYFSQTYYIPRKLKHVTVLGGDVCDRAFYKCSNISEITLSEGVTSIGSVAFSGCTGLTSLSLPDSITSIATRAFYECTGLTSLKMSGNITNFGVGVLDRCNNLESLTTPYVGFKEIVNDKEYIRPLSYLFSSNIPSTLKMVTVLGGEICDEAFSGCNHITRITLSEGVTSIGSKAFSRCTSLTSINIPNGVTSIGAEAFSGCTGLTSINLPNGVTSIGSKAFAECTRLSSIDIPNSLTRIGVEAFANCISLTSLNIPNSVTSTGTRLLMGCNNLESLTIPYVGYRYNSDVKDYDGEAELIEPIGFLFGTASFNGGVETRQYYCCKYISGTKAGQEDSFYCSYYIPSKLKHVAVSRGSICAGAFYGCANISEITLSKGVTSIGAEAFSGCTSLTSINIPNSVTSIGSKAFSGCTWLTLLKLPGSATYISEGILSGCHNLKSLTVPFIGYHLDGEENAWVTESIEPLGWLFGEDEFVASEKTRQYAFRKIRIIPGPNGSAPEPIVTAEFGYDYYIPRALKQVTVLGGDLCAGAFSMCTWITEITLSEGVTSIGEKAFYGCTSLTKVHIPNSLTKIEKDAFVNSGVIEGRSGAIYVGHWVVGVTESVTKLGLSSGTIGIADCAFEQSGITEISFNSELKYIGANAFNGCSELQAVRFPIYYSYFYEGYWCADDIHISGTDLSRPKVAARYLKTTYKDKRWERRVKQE